jgi:hypothetical protein
MLGQSRAAAACALGVARAGDIESDKSDVAVRRHR